MSDVGTTDNEWIGLIGVGLLLTVAGAAVAEIVASWTPPVSSMKTPCAKPCAAGICLARRSTSLAATPA